MTTLILHVPHSSDRIPFNDGYILNPSIIQNEVLKLTDWYTDELFESKNDICIKADFSRIFCDLERFEDDSLEVMAKYGMGVLYERTDDGRLMRVMNFELREKILNDYYRLHHSKLYQAVNQQLILNSEALILDCHSFPDIPLRREIDKSNNRPDINIGSDEYHTPERLRDGAVDFFLQRGYSVRLNAPFSGSIVPVKYYQKDARVSSIMLELNRKLYLKDHSNIKSDNFQEIHNLVGEFISWLKMNPV